MTRYRLIVATIGATLLLGALVTNASAERLSSSSSTFRMTFRELTFSGAFGVIRCEFTLEGSLHTRTMVKTPTLLIGYITAASAGACAAGAVTVLRETLPWHARYSSFSGTLPS